MAGWPLSVPAQAAPRPVIDGFQHLFPALGLPAFSKVDSADLYQFVVDGESFYLSGDGKLLFAGRLWDVASGQDLGEDGIRRFRRQVIESFGEGKTVTYAPEHYRYTVNVFTDIDCGYCRKFHSGVPELQRLGIRVNYLLAPLRGEESRKKAESVWCAKDRNRAMDLAKAGKSVPEKRCPNPIDEHLRFFRLVGARGTPLLLLENGGAVNGYLSPEALLEALKKDAAAARS